MPLFTPDGRYLVVRGRLWRATNPSLEPDDRAKLTRELMAARRTRDRKSVQSAKVALGERGPVWWTDGAPDLNRRLIRNTPYAAWWSHIERFREAILEMLEERGPEKSICPSDVARREETQWRGALDDVRAAARALAEEGLIRVTQKDRELGADETWRGAIRFRLS